MKILVIMVQYQDNKYLEYQSLNFSGVLCISVAGKSFNSKILYIFGHVFILKSLSWNIITFFLKSVLTFEDALEILQGKCHEYMV